MVNVCDDPDDSCFSIRVVISRQEYDPSSIMMCEGTPLREKERFLLFGENRLRDTPNSIRKILTSKDNT